MIITAGKLIESLKEYREDELLMVLFWDKDEYEDETTITDEQWAKALSTVWTNPAEGEISDYISQAVYEQVEAEE